MAAGPRLAPAATGIPAPFRMWRSRAVVVDLPLVPVMPTNCALEPAARAARKRNSASQRIGAPAASARAAAGWVRGSRCGMPGESSSVSWAKGAAVTSATVKPAASAASRCAWLSSQTTISAPQSRSR